MRAADSRLRHRAAEARARRVSAARIRSSRSFAPAPAEPGRRRRDGRGVEGLVMAAVSPASFIDDLKSQANIVQVVQEYVPLQAERGRRTRGCVRSTARRRRRSTSTATRGSSTASAAASAATSSSSSSCTRRSASRTRCGSSPQRFGVTVPGAGRRRGRTRDDAARARGAAEGARGRGGVVPRAARGAGRRAGARGSSQRPRRDRRDHRAARARLRAGEPRRPASARC